MKDLGFVVMKKDGNLPLKKNKKREGNLEEEEEEEA